MFFIEVFKIIILSALQFFTGYYTIDSRTNGSVALNNGCSIANNKSTIISLFAYFTLINELIVFLGFAWTHWTIFFAYFDCLSFALNSNVSPYVSGRCHIYFYHLCQEGSILAKTPLIIRINGCLFFLLCKSRSIYDNNKTIRRKIKVYQQTDPVLFLNKKSMVSFKGGPPFLLSPFYTSIHPTNSLCQQSHSQPGPDKGKTDKANTSLHPSLYCLPNI